MATHSQDFIRLEAVKKTFGGPGGEVTPVEAIASVDQVVNEGEFVVILGPSGCGKSTLLEIVAGLQKPSSGEVFLRDQKITAPHEAMSVVFQEDSTFPWRTVLGNIEFGLEIQGKLKSERRAIANSMIEMVGLHGFSNRYPRELSGGMRQRVAIGRALAVDPEVLLMDEPFGALDQQTRYFLGEELLRIWEATRKTVIFVTHDINEAVLLADRVWVMSHRPSIVKLDLNIDIPRPRSLRTLTDPRFHELSTTLWEALREESTKALTSHEA